MSSTSLPSLPPPFCPPDSPPPAIARLRHEWIQRNAPVLIQPTVDIARGNAFLCAFYHFSPDHSTAVLSLVFEGEDSWEVHRPTAVNRFGSFAYRTHNYRTWLRTADIDHIAYHGCTLQHDGGQRTESPQHDWQLLHTTDFSGLQSWSKGSKGRFLYFYSLMHHYDLELRREGWRRWDDRWTPQQRQQQLEHWRDIDAHHCTANAPLPTRLTQPCTPQPNAPLTQSADSPHHRPVVYLNTGNHCMAPFSTNPSTFPTAACNVHCTYPLFPGDRSVAERFGRLAVRRKRTMYSLLPAGLFAPGGGAMEKERKKWQRVHHSVLLEGGAEERRRTEVKGLIEAQGADRLIVGDGAGHTVAVVEGMDSAAVSAEDA